MLTGEERRRHKKGERRCNEQDRHTQEPREGVKRKRQGDEENNLSLKGI